MTLLVTNIGELVTNTGPALTGAALVVEGGRVAWVGPASRAPAADELLDARGRAGLPGFVDSHTHLVFAENASWGRFRQASSAENADWGRFRQASSAGDRAGEFAARMAGEPYTGGGIQATVAATRAAGDDELRGTVARLVREALRQGTTTIEVKSGYGLSVPDEARSLRIAREVTPETTFLGAHVVPAGFAARADDYVDLVRGDMLDAAAPYARWVDVFCEPAVAFDADQARAVLASGVARGLVPRVHANQLGPGPGVQVAVEVGAASADHCTHLSPRDVEALAGSSTVATLLPGAEFSTRSAYPPARRLLDAGVTVALATDCNPGSSYTSSMAFCVALAVREMGMTPAEAVWAATAGGARALRRDDIGVLRPGARADLVLLDAPSHVYLAYRPGVPLVATVLHNGVPL